MDEDCKTDGLMKTKIDGWMHDDCKKKRMVG